MQFAVTYGLWLFFSILLTSSSHAQPNPSLTPVNYGNIVITATNRPFLIGWKA